MIKRIGILAALVLAWGVSTPVSAQSNEKSSDNPYKGVPFKDRIFLGGDFGLSFGTYTYIRIAPLLGYRVSDRFDIGAGPSYTYYKDTYYEPAFESSIYGGSVFGRYFVLESLFLQTQVEALNLATLNYNYSTDQLVEGRTTIPVWFVGGGFSERTAGGTGFFISAMYDLIQDPNSPYPNNLAIRVGGFIGL